MRIRNWPLGVRQAAGFGAILILLTLINGYSLKTLDTLRAEIDRITRDRLTRVVSISDLNLHTSYLRMNQLQLAVISKEERQERYDLMVKQIDQINSDIDTYLGLAMRSSDSASRSEAEARYYRSFEDHWEEYQGHSLTVLQDLIDDRTDAALALLNGEARVVFEALSDDLVKLVEISYTDAQRSSDLANELFHSSRGAFKLVLLLSVVIAVIGIIAMTVLVTRPIRQLATASCEVAQGNFDVTLPVKSTDEVGRLAGSFNSMTAALKAARAKTEEQANELRRQADTLQQRNRTIEQKNNELEQTLNQLHATQEQLLLREKTAALGELIAGIAHEINNPMGALLSSIDVSERVLARARSGGQTTTGGDASDLLEDNLHVIKTAGVRVATIVKSLRNFIRLDEAEFQQVDIHEGIESSLTLLGQEITQRINIVREYSDLPRLLCNPGQLNQVFLNLIKNAVEALDDGGTVTIQSALESRNIVVRISDTGHGIPPERLKRIFDFGFSSAGERIKLGSGLAAAFKIVQDHKGAITVASTPGKGSTFTVTLPLRQT